jgi:hypothetical protein
MRLGDFALLGYTVFTLILARIFPVPLVTLIPGGDTFLQGPPQPRLLIVVHACAHFATLHILPH